MARLSIRQLARGVLFALTAGMAAQASAVGAGASSRELAGYVSMEGMLARIEHRGGLLAQACRGRSAEIDQMLALSEQLRVSLRGLILRQVQAARQKAQQEMGVEPEANFYQDLKGEQDESALRFRQTFQLSGVASDAQCVNALQVHVKLQKEMDEQLK